MGSIRFLSPVEGDVLITGSDGVEDGGRLLVDVRVEAPQNSGLIVNGTAAEWDGRAFYVQVPLKPGPQRITAAIPGGDSRDIRVLWLKGAEKTVHFTVDDCVRCFEDLTRNKDRYNSLFDNPYLAIWRKVHDTYGFKVHINIFYATEDGKFNLSMMTEKYKDEFRANSDWLSFSFHAVREFPDKLYEFASASVVSHDCEQVDREIRRFAGPEVMRHSTTLHWGEATVQGVRALRDAGYRSLCGYLEMGPEGRPQVSYYLDTEQIDRVSQREALVDFDEGMFFSKLNYVLDKSPWAGDPDKAKEILDDLAKQPHQGQMLQTVIHEQYFYPDYFNYEPDYKDRIMNVADWAYRNGYRSISMTKTVAEMMKEAQKL